MYQRPVHFVVVEREVVAQHLQVGVGVAPEVRRVEHRRIEAHGRHHVPPAASSAAPRSPGSRPISPWWNCSADRFETGIPRPDRGRQLHRMPWLRGDQVARAAVLQQVEEELSLLRRRHPTRNDLVRGAARKDAAQHGRVCRPHADAVHAHVLALGGESQRPRLDVPVQRPLGGVVEVAPGAPARPARLQRRQDVVRRDDDDVAFALHQRGREGAFQQVDALHVRVEEALVLRERRFPGEVQRRRPVDAGVHHHHVDPAEVA